jgi:hypothetical protein
MGGFQVLGLGDVVVLGVVLVFSIYYAVGLCGGEVDGIAWLAVWAGGIDRPYHTRVQDRVVVSWEAGCAPVVVVDREYSLASDW